MGEHLDSAHALLRLAVTGEHGEDPADPATVQAMQLALHLEKQDPPPRSEVLAAAARAAVMVCLDERAATDGDYRAALTDWYNHRIRKVARRARTSGWERVQDLTGVTATDGQATARAFLPGRTDEVPHDISRLQIKGTDLPHDEPGATSAECPVILLDDDLGMTLGKAAAQAGHASMLLAANRPLDWVRDWAQATYPLTVREVDHALFSAATQESDAVRVEDGGFTEVEPGSVTAVALPQPSAQLLELWSGSHRPLR